MSDNSQLGKVKLSDIPDYQAVYVPKGTYKHLVVDAEYVAKSKGSGNPMYTLEVEICDHPGYPDPKTGQIKDPNGTKATVYVSLSDQAAGNVKRFFKGCGLPLDLTMDELRANPNADIFKGRKFLAIGYSKPDAMIDELTQQPIKDPITGQDVIYYRYSVGQVFALPN